MQQLGTQYVARSGMEDSIANGILQGRPFGGVCIAWSPGLNQAIRPLSNFCHKRIVGVELKSNDRDLILLSVYCPFFNSSQRAECVAETIDVISMIETIIEQHPNHSIIIGGDFNTELNNVSPFDSYWSELMKKFNLSSCDHLLPPNSFSYHHEALDHKKLNDHFIISNSLSESFSNHKIIDDGENLSDHRPIVITLSSSIQEFVPECSSNNQAPKLKWEKLTYTQIENYASVLNYAIDSVSAPVLSCHSKNVCRCRSSDCMTKLQSEYDSIIDCMKFADSSLPRHKPGLEKDWWTEELSQLKNQSIEAHSLWVNEGRPKQGPTHKERIRVRARYKCAIRAAQRAPKQMSWDRLHSSLSQKDTSRFWCTWRRMYNKNKNSHSPIVDGVFSKQGIADTFMHVFQKNSKPNNPSKVEDLNREFSTTYANYVHNHVTNCDCKSSYVSLSNVIDALTEMKCGKSADEDTITAEHLLNAPLNLLKRLTTLFNSMLNHAFVPKQFRFGFMIPLIKDQQGNHTDSNNYRGITISPIISKLFEHCLKIVFHDHLSTSNYQFGFKKSSSTVHAIYCMRQTINYYIDNGSRVYCSYLDASKAFDRLVHSGLFLKLINRGIPLVFLEVIMSWYNGLKCRVKWDGHFSDWFTILAGVRQGGVLSPDFYSIYVDELIAIIQRSNKGCYVNGVFMAALFYADDMALLAPSIKGLSLLLEICSEYCIKWDICLNAKKTRNMYFGKRSSVLFEIQLNGQSIDWAKQWTYLGVSLNSSKKFDCSISEKIKKFYKCTNAIFRIDGYSNDLVMLQLVETHCVPLLTYAIEVIDVLNRDEKRQLRVAYNSLFRKFFHYRRYDSVTALQHFLSRPTWEELVEKRTHGFEMRVRTAGQSTPAF